MLMKKNGFEFFYFFIWAIYYSITRVHADYFDYKEFTPHVNYPQRRLPESTCKWSVLTLQHPKQSSKKVLEWLGAASFWLVTYLHVKLHVQFTCNMLLGIENNIKSDNVYLKHFVYVIISLILQREIFKHDLIIKFCEYISL